MLMLTRGNPRIQSARLGNSEPRESTDLMGYGWIGEAPTRSSPSATSMRWHTCSDRCWQARARQAQARARRSQPSTAPQAVWHQDRRLEPKAPTPRR